MFPLGPRRQVPAYMYIDINFNLFLMGTPGAPGVIQIPLGALGLLIIIPNMYWLYRGLTADAAALFLRL